MKIVSMVILALVLCTQILAQKEDREQKIAAILDLRSQISVLEKEILQPAARDIEIAEKQGCSAIRILPREKYDRVLAISGGGAYYSFFNKTHEYGHGNDLELQQGNFSVGFAGADYGFLKDLGEVALGNVDKETTEIAALLKYVPPADEPSIRAEAQKLWKGYEINGISFTSRVPAVAGHSFLLRSIDIDNSDIAVVFSVLRKDADGSLILFWKPIESFPKPTMQREKVAAIY